MSVNALHVTNGDSVLYLWKKAGLLGTHIAWRDMLHEGPVVADLPLEELSRIRGDYLASRGFGNAIKLHHDLEKRDAAIRRAEEFEEIVLWFEHDLYDQLHLLQILAVLQEQGIGAGAVQLVQSDQYLGMLTADETDGAAFEAEVLDERDGHWCRECMARFYCRHTGNAAHRRRENVRGISVFGRSAQAFVRGVSGDR